MSLFDPTERRLADLFRRLSYCNPFVPERIDIERGILGEAFIPTGAAWHKDLDEPAASPNLDALTDRAESLADQARARLLEGCTTDDADLELYETVVLYLVYNRHQAGLHTLICEPAETQRSGGSPVAFFEDFLADLERYLALPGRSFPSLAEPEHLFACLYQVRRAFHHIFEYIIGGSTAIARLRATVWQSIFTHDAARYRRNLYRRMGDIATLITGPSGTGKELVARAVGLSRYVPFDLASKRFADDGVLLFYPINLSALSPTLIESELFGHRRGSFTGAAEDHAGWLEACSSLGTVFLDELGETDVSIQVKLLRVIETRTFYRIGETRAREFRGKVVAATNRDLLAEMQTGRMRADLYYRLCSDVIVTPSLREQFEDSHEQLHNLLVHIARVVVGLDEADLVAGEVEEWIVRNLGLDYPWPGNVRELEQCVRNVLIH